MKTVFLHTLLTTVTHYIFMTDAKFLTTITTFLVLRFSFSLQLPHILRSDALDTLHILRLSKVFFKLHPLFKEISCSALFHVDLGHTLIEISSICLVTLALLKVNKHVPQIVSFRPRA